ncbi:MAG: sarcosine oxidase subunit delta [Alphaproteobacteria bacterium]|nr:sarcosine oxidase subunit delta [Alphaproteobacteria bacterium]
MHRIDCPWCGVRDEAEFSYRGDATVKRPPADGGAEGFYAYVYDRTNPKGWHVEWWHHVAGCRQFLKVVRHTVTHEIRSVAKATDEVAAPPA